MIIPVGPEGGNQVLCRVQKVSILLQLASCGLSAIRARDLSLSPLAVIPFFSVAFTRSSLSTDQGSRSYRGDICSAGMFRVGLFLGVKPCKQKFSRV